MSFLQKNKSILVILLMVGFLVVILAVFLSGLSDSDSVPPTADALSQPMNFVTSTGNALSSPIAVGTPLPEMPQGTSAPPPGVTVQATAVQQTPALSSPPPGFQGSAATNSGPGTDAPPPPTSAAVDAGPPGTDFPPPLTFVPLPTETPPPGNGTPPGG